MRSELSLEEPNTVQESKVLAWVFVLSVLVMLGAFWAASEWASPNLALAVLVMSIVMGFFGVAAFIEKTLARQLQSFRVSVLFWGLLVTSAFFIARMKAIVDINSIFHIDPSAFPMTLAAATAIHIASFLFWPSLIIVLLTLVFLAYAYRSDEFSAKPMGEKWILSTHAIGMCCMCGLGAFFIGTCFSDTRRPEILYRVAHLADFNSTFNCQNIDPTKESVVFLGPEQRRVIVAKNIEEPFLLAERNADILKSVDIPQQFSVLECSPQNPIRPEPLPTAPNAFGFEIKPSP
jgi:hypothetical protein